MNITIASYEEAHDLLGRAADNFEHVVSINDPDVHPPETMEGHRARQLVLHFYDIEEPGPDLAEAPTRDHVRAVVRFAKDVSDGHRVLVHCAAGISRSSATALTIIASKHERTAAGADRALRALLEVKREIHPNATIVRHADKLLGFKGALVRRYEEIFPAYGVVMVPLKELDALMKDAGIEF